MNDEATRMVGKARGEYETRKKVLDTIRKMQEFEENLRPPVTDAELLRLRSARNLRRWLEDFYRGNWGPLPETPAVA